MDISSRQTLTTEKQNEAQLGALFMQAPVGFSLARGNDYVMELANKEFLRLTGRDESIIGKKIIEIFTEIEDQGYLALLNRVLNNKKTIFLNESPAIILINGVRQALFINTVLQPYYDGKDVVGVLSILTDVTEQVMARKKIEESNRQLQFAATLTQNIADAVIGTSTMEDGYLITSWNKGAEIIYGWKADEVIGKPAPEILITHYFSEADKKNSRISLEEKGYWQGEIKQQRKDGKMFWVNASIGYVKDKEGKIIGAVGVNRDITKQKESEEKLRVITDAVPHMVWEIDLDGTISYINKQWADYSGLTLEEINKGGWSKIFHPEDAEAVGKGWTEAFENKKIYLGECRIKNPEGGYSWFTLKTVPVKNDKGEVELWIGTATDINDKKIADQQKDQFISIASHELKTPVTSLKGFTQILQMRFEKEGNNSAVDLLTKMDKQVDKLTKLIVDLLDATKIENGQLQFFKENFDFNELVMEIVEEMQRTTENHKISVMLADSKIIYADRNRIGQVITNLISNAIKYSPDTHEILITSSFDKTNIKLCVKDFGIGIPAEKHSKIFERFFRVVGDRQYTFPGLGLGLFISSEIIKRHDGKIYLESADQKGSTFCFTLPVAK